MIEFECNELRIFDKLLSPKADFDSEYTFYYDETNNIRKFYVKEFDFNADFRKNFVIGGLVFQESAPNMQILIDNLNLQNNINEIKFKHIAKGNFLNCLKSSKLKIFLNFILKSNLFIHYSGINLLYWSIVDIVDSAIIGNLTGNQIQPELVMKIKNDLYQLSKLEIDLLIQLFYKFEYPNIKKGSIHLFIEEFCNLFKNCPEDSINYFGLECLRQLLNQAKKKESLPFLTNEDDFTCSSPDFI